MDMTPFDLAVIEYADVLGVESAVVYRLVDSSGLLWNDRAGYTDEQLIAVLEEVKRRQNRGKRD